MATSNKPTFSHMLELAVWNVTRVTYYIIALVNNRLSVRPTVDISEMELSKHLENVAFQDYRIV